MHIIGWRWPDHPLALLALGGFQPFSAHWPHHTKADQSILHLKSTSVSLPCSYVPVPVGARSIDSHFSAFFQTHSPFLFFNPCFLFVPQSCSFPFCLCVCPNRVNCCLFFTDLTLPCKSPAQASFPIWDSKIWLVKSQGFCVWRFDLEILLSREFFKCLLWTKLCLFWYILNWKASNSMPPKSVWEIVHCNSSNLSNAITPAFVTPLSPSPVSICLVTESSFRYFDKTSPFPAVQPRCM